MKKSTIIAVTALTVGCIAVPTAAQAGNGGAWLLGRSNYETTATTVSNSRGSALTLNSKAGYAPFRVNRTTKVPNLNADLVDGYSAASFAMRSGKTGTVVHNSNADSWGAKCPAGTVFVSGGGSVQYTSDNMLYSGPDWDPTTEKVVPNSWLVIGYDAYSGTLSYGKSYVTCYQPSGAAVAGAATTLAQLFPESPAALSASGKADQKLEQAKARLIPAK
jgi:hypothetical protein